MSDVSGEHRVDRAAAEAIDEGAMVVARTPILKRILPCSLVQNRTLALVSTTNHRLYQ